MKKHDQHKFKLKCFSWPTKMNSLVRLRLFGTLSPNAYASNVIRKVCMSCSIWVYIIKYTRFKVSALQSAELLKLFINILLCHKFSTLRMNAIRLPGDRASLWKVCRDFWLLQMHTSPSNKLLIILHTHLRTYATVLDEHTSQRFKQTSKISVVLGLLRILAITIMCII